MPGAAPADPARGGRRWMFEATRAALLLLWLLGTAGLAWLLLVFPAEQPAARYRDVPIQVAPGTGLEALTDRLVEEGVVHQRLAFVLYLRLLGADDRLRSGPVVVNRALSARALLPRIATGFGEARVRVSIPEGFTRFDVAARLSRFGICGEAEFEQAGSDRALLQSLGIAADSVEGYLFPATYELTQGSAPARVLREMVRVFRERTRARLAAYERARDGAPFSLDLHELVTLASIVEKEAQEPSERPTIAGVFLNRLTSPDFRPRRLQADPTVAYGCLVAGESIPSCREFDGRRITPAMVRDPENPYSTYRREGLPPGPICNPGLSALDAVLQPEPHEFFYFVTRGGGRHVFSRTLSEHNAHIQGALR